MPFAFSIAPCNMHFASFQPCEEVEASAGRVAPLGYARIARVAPLGYARYARVVCTSLEANGRSCRVGGDAEVRNGEVRNLFERRGIPSTSAPPRRGKGDLLPFARLGRGWGSGTGDFDRSARGQGELVTQQLPWFFLSPNRAFLPEGFRAARGGRQHSNSPAQLTNNFYAVPSPAWCRSPRVALKPDGQREVTHRAQRPLPSRRWAEI